MTVPTLSTPFDYAERFLRIAKDHQAQVHQHLLITELVTATAHGHTFTAEFRGRDWPAIVSTTTPTGASREEVADDDVLTRLHAWLHQMGAGC